MSQVRSIIEIVIAVLFHLHNETGTRSKSFISIEALEVLQRKKRSILPTADSLVEFSLYYPMVFERIGKFHR